MLTVPASTTQQLPGTIAGQLAWDDDCSIASTRAAIMRRAPGAMQVR